MISTPIGTTVTGKRSFPVAFRIAFLAAWDDCVGHGDKARLLREHGLAKATVKRWLDARDQGRLDASVETAMSKDAGRTPSQDRAELARLRRENERLQAKLRNAEVAQEIMGKAYELLQGIDLSSPDPQTQIPPALMSKSQFAEWLARKRL